MSEAGETFTDQVDYVSGRTRLFGIVGHPIEQVRSPEMFTAEFRRRGLDAILVPLHVLPDDFDALLPQLLRLSNLDGVIFTIPYKLRACTLADRLGEQARISGDPRSATALGVAWRHVDTAASRRFATASSDRQNALCSAPAGGIGDRGRAASNDRRRFGVTTSTQRAPALARRAGHSGLAVASERRDCGIDILLNATPSGMPDDARLPMPSVTACAMMVFDAIVKPETTPLLLSPNAAAHDGPGPRNDARPDCAHRRFFSRFRLNAGARSKSHAGRTAGRSARTARPQYNRWRCPRQEPRCSI